MEMQVLLCHMNFHPSDFSWVYVLIVDKVIFQVGMGMHVFPKSSQADVS